MSTSPTSPPAQQGATYTVKGAARRGSGTIRGEKGMGKEERGHVQREGEAADGERDAKERGGQMHGAREKWVQGLESYTGELAIGPFDKPSVY